jgi:hypothetical protein
MKNQLYSLLESAIMVIFAFQFLDDQKHFHVLISLLEVENNHLVIC